MRAAMYVAGNPTTGGQVQLSSGSSKASETLCFRIVRDGHPVSVAEIDLVAIQGFAADLLDFCNRQISTTMANNMGLNPEGAEGGEKPAEKPPIGFNAGASETAEPKPETAPETKPAAKPEPKPEEKPEARKGKPVRKGK